MPRGWKVDMPAFRVMSSFRSSGFGFRGFRVSEFRVEGSGLQGFRVQCLGFRGPRLRGFRSSGLWHLVSGILPLQECQRFRDCQWGSGEHMKK